MSEVQIYKDDVDFKINKGFNKIYKDIKNNNGDLYKVIDFADGSQVLYFGGGHDDMGIGTFIFKNNAKTRNAFHSQPYGGIDGSDYGTDCSYILHTVQDYKVAPYKDDRKGKADIDWRKIRAMNTVDDLVTYIDNLDTYDTWYGDKNWTGYDFCFSTDKSRD